MGAKELDPRSTIEAWRAQGADRLDRVRFHRLDAMARRADAAQGELRRVLEGRVYSLIGAYADDLRRLEVGAEPAANDNGGLNELTARLQREAVQRESAWAGAGDAEPAAFPRLAALDEFRARWSRLSLDRQVRQSLERAPANAGPLNSGRLVHRALNLMQSLSPEYLQHFLGYVDALAWMERLSEGLPEPEEAAPAAAPAKRSRKRRE
ncbi:DUF2894 domain-containing protein [Lysobacter sp. K5869]|uniref:DUF2894 domain-containing protein n=1 Tax=Lysobacter sp. K5869 TaxID=2820808 RepID=UPI001C0606CC|nr:DUF2894 domain-containing protein [Lysobacter sp. K5869]QWP77085.1 DUF2894 domain-containing protein [Lysobacter sp. K5869]